LAKKNPINHQIRAKKVRLIDSNGKNLGIVSTDQAFKKARLKNLDLVLVAEKARPPVARIINYGKYRYLQRKKQQKGKKSVEMKEIRLSINIEEHDLNVKLKKAEEFLKKGHPLKIGLMMFGRQQAFLDQAQKKIEDFIDKLKSISSIDQPIKKEGQSFTAILKPK